ncbi:hypothetical protein ATO67_12505 [Agrobacterium bohemicum]|uniref:Uncharacterized protein n=1 Tax=Agrobacterium bohemicum TaxID=2052828 RepID=A0A135NYR5_9HYPH|nr:hypothetical protein ATO67_12505 [Agrobacterium bohemicum]
MDFLSIILAALGIQRERASKASDRRIEAYRLVSEVSAEAAQAANMVATAMPGIMRRLQVLYPDQPEIPASCSTTLTTMFTQAKQLHEMAEGYKPTVEKGSNWADWELALRKLHEWRSTASLLRPQTETIIRRYEELLTQAELDWDEPLSPPQQPPRSERDRGWDAPPL